MTAFGQGIFGAGIFGGGGAPSTGGGGGGAGETPTPETNLSFLSLVGTNGDVIPIDVAATDYAALNGATGIGIPPRALTLIEGAGDGGVIRYVRTGPRDIDIPIGIFGDTRGEVLEKQRRLASAVRPRPGQGPARLRFVLEGGDVYQIGVWYAAGAETTISSADGTFTYARWPVTFRAPDPYWESVDETPFVVATVGSTRGLLPALTRLRLAAGAVFGATQITNPGDVPADIVWTITGPGGPFTATVADTGESFSITDTLGAGEVITVDTKAGTVTDATGANRYASLGSAPKLFRLPEGTSTVQVSLPSATSASRVVGRYRARREVVY